MKLVMSLGQSSPSRRQALEEDTRGLKQGVHRYRRQEAMTCRDPEKEVNIVVEKLKKEQPSD